jgi:hypothetical protein
MVMQSMVGVEKYHMDGEWSCRGCLPTRKRLNERHVPCSEGEDEWRVFFSSAPQALSSETGGVVVADQSQDAAV